MKRRPPLLGYNHNVRHAGQIFHVQTEDSGPGRPRVTTHVFFRGTILATSRSTYDPEAPDEVVQRLMQSQHKAALRQIRDGTFDERALALGAEIAAAPAAAQTPATELVRLDRPGATVVTTAPYNPSMSTLERSAPPSEFSLLTDAELAELVDLAAGSLEFPSSPASAEGLEEAERVLELEAEPPSEDEVLLLQQQAPLEPGPPPASSQQTPSQMGPYASQRSPRRIAVWAPSGGYMARQYHSNPPVPPPEAARSTEDLPAEPTRIRLSPSRSAGRPPGRTFRTTARRLDPGPYRPRPTAEGVVVQRPLIVTDQGILDPEDRDAAPPKPPPSSDERSLDQVILAYLAEDTGKKR